jgi:VIT1/CCC1 family predicted Fe2+/Mn2+ transporter
MNWLRAGVLGANDGIVSVAAVTDPRALAGRRHLRDRLPARHDGGRVSTVSAR